MSPLALAFFLLLCFQCTPAQECAPIPANASDFCFGGLPPSAFNGHNSSTSQEFSLFNQLLQGIWPIYTKVISTNANLHGFQVCDDCITALKQMACASFFPGCNFFSCYESVAGQLALAIYTCVGTNQQDADACVTQGYSSSACQEFLDAIYKAAANSFEVSTCFLAKQSAIFNNATCFQNQIMGKAMCQNFIDICLCNPTSTLTDEICAYFPEQGYVIDFPSGLSCSSSSGWCGNGKRSTGANGANQACPNDYICMAVPQSIESQSGIMLVQTSFSSASTLSIPVTSFFAF